MNRISEILKNLENGVPQALARFNDGEMGGIEMVGFIAARGDQRIDQSLHDALKEAIQYEQERYWVGIPCQFCFPRMHKLARSLVREDYEWLTSAVVTSNRNWKLFVQRFPAAVKGKAVEWVSGADQDLGKLDFKVGAHTVLRRKNSWSQYDAVKDLCDRLAPGTVVVLSCGPMARVLVRRWFERRPDCTYLDLGSCFDPFTRNVRHRCHTGDLPPCEGCN
jgi:hypothetical protein